MSIPRIIALLPWWNESSLWLSALVTSLAPHIDHLVAVDGRYGLYQDEGYQSRSDQACSIVECCQAAGIGLTLHRPQFVWLGNELEKRTFLFRAAELEAEPNVDWYWAVDADVVVDHCPGDLKHRLAATDMDAAEVMVIERGDPQQNSARAENERNVSLPPDSIFPTRMLYRAIPGLEVVGHHATYRTPDGRYLWGMNHALEPVLDLHDLRVEHRTHFRTRQRHEAAQAYYRRRAAAGAETLYE